MTEMKGCSFVSPVLALTPSITHRAHHGVFGSCACQLCASARVCDQFVCIHFKVCLCTCVYSVGINIPSVSLSALMCTMCVVYSVYVSYMYALGVCVCVCVIMCSVNLHAMCLLRVAHLVLLCCTAQPAL